MKIIEMQFMRIRFLILTIFMFIGINCQSQVNVKFTNASKEIFKNLKVNIGGKVTESLFFQRNYFRRH